MNNKIPPELFKIYIYTTYYKIQEVPKGVHYTTDASELEETVSIQI